MIELNNNKIELILAPMSEITDYPFRQINKKFGADLTFTQMVSARGIASQHFDTLKFLVFDKKEKPIGVQLLIENEEYVEDSLSTIIKLKPDIIDLNAGCPSNEICKKGLGAQLLNNPAKLYKLLEKIIVNAKDIPVSVKLRIGFDKINIFEILDYIDNLPLHFITIHARLRNQFYTGQPDYDIVRKIKDKYDKKIVFNGSCFTVDDYIKIKELTNADAVMIARGALGNPFIFTQIKNKISSNNVDMVTKEDILEVAKEHCELIYKTYGEINFAKMARKYLIWYFMYFENIYKFIGDIYKVEQYNDILNYINEFSQKNNYNPNSKLAEEIKELFYNRVLFWVQ